MQKKRIFPIISVTAVLLSALIVLSSCGIIIINHPDPSDETTDGTTDAPIITDIPDDNPVTTTRIIEVPDYEGEAAGYLEKAAARNFNGAPVYIAATSPDLFEAADGNLYNTAVVKRNEEVEKKLNTRIITVPADITTILDEVKKAQQLGESYADLLAIPAGYIGIFASEDCLLNMYSIPYVDYTQPYYNQQAIAQTTAGNKTFAVSGSALDNADSVSCVLFNKSIAKELGIVSMYSEVYKNTWTWDRFLELSRLASESGYTGYVSALSEEETLSSILASSGQSFMKCEYGALPYRDFNNVKTEKLAEAAKELLFTRSYAGESDYGSPGLGSFQSRNTLFCLAESSVMPSVSTPGLVWGLLPMPKCSEADEHYGALAAGTKLVFCSPVNNPNIDHTGFLLQALNAASYGVIRQAYYDRITVDVICDTDTISMLDLAAGGVLYDFVTYFGPSSDVLISSTCGVLGDSVREGKPLVNLLTESESSLLKYFNENFK